MQSLPSKVHYGFLSLQYYTEFGFLISTQPISLHFPLSQKQYEF